MNGEIYVNRIIRITILWLFIIDASLISLGALFSGKKIAVFALIIIAFADCLINNKKLFLSQYFFNIQKNILIFMGFVSIYSFTNYFFSSYSTTTTAIYPGLLYFILWCILLPVFYQSFYHDVKTFLEDYIWVICLEAVTVYMQFFSRAFREFLNSTFVYSGNLSYLYTKRGSGIGLEGANLSMVLFSGMFACLLLIVKYQEKMLLKIFVLLFLAGATFLSGRTGLYFAIGAIAIIIAIYLFKEVNIRGSGFSLNVRMVKLFGRITASLIIGGIIYILGFSVFFSNAENMTSFDNLSEWAFTLFSTGTEDNFFVNIGNQEIPRLSIDTLVGTAIIDGTTATGTTIRHDSGYIKYYAALGLILAVIFYLVFLIYYLKLVKVQDDFIEKVLLIYFIGVMYMSEVKEPFMSRYYMPFFLIMITFISIKEKKNNPLDPEEKNCENTLLLRC